MIFAVASVLSWTAMRWAMTLASLAALGRSLWLVFGARGYKDRPAVRLGATLGVSALALATEPVQQTLALGQVNLLLMLLVVADLLTAGALTPGGSQGRTRWWHGLGIGIAAGVTLTPLIFIPYLLLIRRYRQAATAAGVFAATAALGYAILPGDSSMYWAHGLFLKANRIVFLGTRGNQSLRGVLTRLAGSVSDGAVPWIAAAIVIAVAGLVATAMRWAMTLASLAALGLSLLVVIAALGYAILPGDSSTYWAHGLFLQANRIVFLGTRGNQSLRGVLTRLAGSVSEGTVPWIAAAIVIAVAGLAAAALLYRARQPVPAMLACALTGLLVSPLSWDHHWVWVAPGIALLAHLGTSAARGLVRAAWWVAAACLFLVFACWPQFWNLGQSGLTPAGLGWYAPGTYFATGSKPWYHEFHWHGLQLLAGNSTVLAGLACLAALVVAAVLCRTRERPSEPGP